MISSFFTGFLFAQELVSDAAMGVRGYAGEERYDFQLSRGRQRIVDVGDFENKLEVRGFRFGLKTYQDVSQLVQSQSGQNELHVTDMLVYPNPFSQSFKTVTFGDETDSKHKALLGYELSRDADFDLVIYNMLGRLIYKRHFKGGANGARSGYNLLSLSKILMHRTLSTGIYFAYIVSDDKVLAKTKFGVKP